MQDVPMWYSFNNRNRVRGMMLLSAAFCFLLSCGRDSSGEREFQHGEGSVLSGDLASLPGADMNIYDLYVKYKDGDYNTACTYLDVFVSDVDTACMSADLAVLCDELADYYSEEKFLYSKAVALRSRSLAICRSNRDNMGEAVEKRQLAVLYFRSGQYHKAFPLALESMYWFEDRGMQQEALDCYNVLGGIYYLCRDTDKSSYYLKTYLEAARQAKDTAALAGAINNIALNSLHDSLKTKSLIDEAVRICGSISDSNIKCKIYLNIAVCYLSSNSIGKASYYLDKALPFVDNVENEGLYHTDRAILEVLSGNGSGAIEGFNKALACFGQGEFTLERKYCYEMLHGLYAGERSYDKAYMTLAQYLMLEKNNAGDEVFKELLRTQNEMQTKRQQEQAERKATVQMAVVLVLLAVLVNITFVLMFRIRRKKSEIRHKETELYAQRLLNDKHDLEIKAKNELLEIRNIQKNQIDKLSERVVKELVRLKSEMKDPYFRNRISGICADMDNIINDSRYKELSDSITEFESAFSRNLSNEHPSLSVNERRLCVFLNKNLSSKEISEITGQHPMTINTARARLRHKLGISGKPISIQEYLSKFN